MSRSASCDLAVGCSGLLSTFGNFFPICLWVLHQGLPQVGGPGCRGSALGTALAGVTQWAPLLPLWKQVCGHPGCGIAWVKREMLQMAPLGGGGCRCTCRCHAQAVILFTALHQKCYWNHYKLCLLYNLFFLYLVYNYSTSKKRCIGVFCHDLYLGLGRIQF